MSITDDDRAFAQGMYRHHPQSPGRSTATFDEPKPRPTPDDITKRAEDFLSTGAVRCYGDLNQRELQEFWREVWLAKERRAR